jgi:hypothetical protein
LRKRIESFFFAALLAFAGSAGTAFSSADGKFYCCFDAAGKYVCGDILPQGCYGRAHRELGADGRTLREVAAPPSAEEIAQKAAAEEKRRQEEMAQKEQQRKDQILLEIYSSLEDIEVMRKHALEDIQKTIGNIEARIGEIREQRKKLENEAEFYKKKTLPAEIKKGLEDTELEIKEQEAVVEARKKDMEAIQSKYDDDRKRFLDLRQRMRMKMP